MWACLCGRKDKRRERESKNTYLDSEGYRGDPEMIFDVAVVDSARFRVGAS